MREFDLNQVYYVCPFKFYGFASKKKESLKAHLYHRHDVGIPPFQDEGTSKELIKKH